jgi:hypothetical protein
VAPIVLSPTGLAFVNVDGLLRTADFLRVAQNVVQNVLSTYIGPISGGCGAELMLLLDSLSRNAAKDVVNEEQNTHVIENTLPKELPVPD